MFFPSCSTTVEKKDVVFSEKQLDFADPYKTGDTLVFENKNYLPDTIILHSLIKGQNYLHVNIRPIFAGDWQKTVTDQGAAPSYKKFIALSKTSGQDPGSVTISYKGFQCSFVPDTIKSITQLTVAGKTYSCYVLSHQFPETIKRNDYVLTLFWDKKQGLVAYQARGGGRWTIKNGH